MEGVGDERTAVESERAAVDSEGMLVPEVIDDALVVVYESLLVEADGVSVTVIVVCGSGGPMFVIVTVVWGGGEFMAVFVTVMVR